CARVCLFFLPPRPPSSTLFPYTTLFRSQNATSRPCGVWCLTAYSQAPGRTGSAVASSHCVRQLLFPPRPSCGLSSIGFSVLTSADRKITRLNSSHVKISYAVFCLKKKKT